MKSILASIAAFAVVLAPISAQAGTRASDNTVSLAGSARLSGSTETALGLGSEGEGKGCRKREEAEKKRPSTCEVIVWLAGSAWLLAFLIRVSETGDFRAPRESDSSFGTGG